MAHSRYNLLALVRGGATNVAIPPGLNDLKSLLQEIARVNKCLHLTFHHTANPSNTLAIIDFLYHYPLQSLTVYHINQTMLKILLRMRLFSPALKIQTDLATWPKLSNFKNPVTLDLSHSNFGPMSMNICQSSVSENLRHLDVSYTMVSQEALRFIGTNTPRLVSFAAGRDLFTPEECDGLVHVINGCRGLQKFQLTGYREGAGSWKLLFDALNKLEVLDELSLLCTDLSLWLPHYAGLRVRTLSANGSRFELCHLRMMNEALRDSRIETLGFKGCIQGDYAWKHINLIVQNLLYSMPVTLRRIDDIDECEPLSKNIKTVLRSRRMRRAVLFAIMCQKRCAYFMPTEMWMRIAELGTSAH